MRLSFACLLLACATPQADAPAERGASPPPAPGRAAPVRGPEPAEELPTPDGDTSIHGALRTVDGQRVLHVWGTPREMGYAHGYLLREAILGVVDGYALEAIPPVTFAAAAPVFAAAADVSPALREEAAGVIAGMEAAGGARSAGLGRGLTSADLLLLNAMTDLVAIGCSSVSAWGAATAAEPRLDGELAIVRNLDWSPSPALLESQVIIAYEPSDPRRQPLVSVAFAGYIGCLSCVNEAGVAGLFNMGYGDGAASMSQAAEGFAPANLLLREALGARDVDGDGRSSGEDVIKAVRGRRHAGSYIVHVVEPAKAAAAAGRPPARVLEIEATGVATRRAEAGSRLGGEVLAATNHLRAEQRPQACSRYRRIESVVESRGRSLGLDALWSLGESVRIDPQVVHTLLLLPGERSLKVRLRAPGETMRGSPAGVWHTWAELFAAPPAGGA
ncbi:MAG: C45 family peptidase [Nannocystaceae bacterium]